MSGWFHAGSQLRFVVFAVFLSLAGLKAEAAPPDGRYLYVATPGVRNYLEYGGHGLLVFDIDHGHRFVKRIPTGGVDDKGVPRNVKGICAHAASRRVYVSTTHTLQALDLVSEKVLWER